MKAMGLKSTSVTLRLDAPPFPPQLDYLWQYYCQHTLGLAVSGMAPAVVTWEGLRSWCALMEIELDPEEALVLVRLGYEAASAQSEKINDVAQKP
jgi:hypothetical protein